jgi:hypothetical protein
MPSPKKELEDPHEAITAEEIEGTAEPVDRTSKVPNNACIAPYF